MHQSRSQSFKTVLESEKFKILGFNRMFKVHSNYMHTCTYAYTFTQDTCMRVHSVVSHDFILFLNCGKIHKFYHLTIFRITVQ